MLVLPFYSGATLSASPCHSGTKAVKRKLYLPYCCQQLKEKKNKATIRIFPLNGIFIYVETIHRLLFSCSCDFCPLLLNARCCLLSGITVIKHSAEVEIFNMPNLSQLEENWWLKSAREKARVHILSPLIFWIWQRRRNFQLKAMTCIFILIYERKERLLACGLQYLTWKWSLCTKWASVFHPRTHIHTHTRIAARSWGPSTEIACLLICLFSRDVIW